MMRQSIIIGVAGGVAVFFFQGFVPRIGTGEIAWLVRLVGDAIIGGLAGLLIHLIRR